MSSKYSTVEIEGHDLRLSNLDKVLYPSVGFTKGQVIDYYVRMAPAILPYLQGRPLTLKRYPGGVEESFFYEKRCPSHRPDWMPTASVYSEGNKDYVNFCVVESVAGLVWVANLASLELHTLLSRQDDIDRPTMMVFDLDPGEPAGLVQCAQVALDVRKLLGELKLQSWAKTSGGKGLHLYVPLNTPVAFDQTKGFARAVAAHLEATEPSRVTSNMRKELRKGKVFVDWSQNDDHKTTCCTYSLRARQRPTVSTPLTWEEIETLAGGGDASAVSFEAADAANRVNALGDLFAPVLTKKQKLAQFPR